ncbi:MAG: PIG-L deacetylase family protein [Infirmifilum sp.]
MSYPEDSLEELVRRRVSEVGLTNALREIAYQLYPETSAPFEAVEKILCVQPHPDDCEYGAGGTLASLSGKGVDIVYLTLTDGSMGTTDPSVKPEELARVRRAEQEEAARIIGVSKILWLDYKDTMLPYSVEARNRVLSVVRAERPDIVLAPDPWLMYEAHPDHRNAGLLAVDAVMFSPLPHVNAESKPHIVPMIAYYYTARPNFFYDVTETLEKKLQALSKHKSQFDSIWPVFSNEIRTLAAAYGQVIGTRYAEAFRVHPRGLLHATPLSELL